LGGKKIPQRMGGFVTNQRNRPGRGVTVGVNEKGCFSRETQKQKDTGRVV